MSIEDIDTVKECDYLVSAIFMDTDMVYLFSLRRFVRYRSWLSECRLARNESISVSSPVNQILVVSLLILRSAKCSAYLYSFQARRAGGCLQVPQPEGCLFAYRYLI